MVRNDCGIQLGAFERVAALIHALQQRHQPEARDHDDHDDGDRSQRRKDRHDPPDRGRQPVDDGVDADVKIAPGDRNRAGKYAEDHQEQHQLLGPAERRAEKISGDHVRAVDRDDAQQRQRRDGEAGVRDAVAEPLDETPWRRGVVRDVVRNLGHLHSITRPTAGGSRGAQRTRAGTAFTAAFISSPTMQWPSACRRVP